jgi:hypothetical protein
MLTHLLGLPLHDFQVIFLCIKQTLGFIDQLSRYYNFDLRHGGVYVCGCGVSVIGRRGKAGSLLNDTIATLYKMG